eukprot:COSAG04_NODE_18548_length_438_cov_8.094395_2_plen_62_part_00
MRVTPVVVVRRFSTMLLVHYFLPEVGVKMETVQQQRLLRSMSERPQVRPAAQPHSSWRPPI